MPILNIYAFVSKPFPQGQAYYFGQYPKKITLRNKNSGGNARSKFCGIGSVGFPILALNVTIKAVSF